MTQFAEAADLAAYLGVTLTDDETTRADVLLGLASGVIQREARQTIELVEDGTLTRPGTPNQTFRLPERPVQEVSQVKLNDVAVTDYVLDADRLIRSYGWGTVADTVEVTYTHGVDTIPPVIQAVCLSATTRVWINPAGVMRERIGSEETDYLLQGTPSGFLLTTDERRAVHDAIRRLAGSVALQ